MALRGELARCVQNKHWRLGCCIKAAFMADEITFTKQIKCSRFIIMQTRTHGFAALEYLRACRNNGEVWPPRHIHTSSEWCYCCCCCCWRRCCCFCRCCCCCWIREPSLDGARITFLYSNRASLGAGETENENTWSVLYMETRRTCGTVKSWQSISAHENKSISPHTAVDFSTISTYVWQCAMPCHVIVSGWITMRSRSLGRPAHCVYLTVHI